MSLPAPLLKLVSRFYKRERDPHRAFELWRHFDEKVGYAEYAARCRAAFRREPPPPADGELARRGFTYLRALDAPTALSLASDLEHRRPQLLKKDSRHLEGFRVEDRQWTRDLLERILQGDVDRAIAGYFGSEYLVHWVALALTRPVVGGESVSFRWHCDKGPSQHLKIIVYLNPTADHGGNTEFMDRDDTLAVAREGYLFGWSKLRTSEVEDLSRLAGRPLATRLEERDAGEAVLFEPSRVLHRGVTPTRGPRLTATLCLLPSPVHWREAYEAGVMSDLAVDDKWHDDALAFLADLQQKLAARAAA
jgi:hypothetical protein